MTDPVLLGVAKARDEAGLDGAITVATLMANGLSRFEAEKAIGQLAAFLRRKKPPETPEESIARMLKSRVDGSDAADVVPALLLAGRVAGAIGSRLLTKAAAKKAAALIASEAAWEAGMYGAGRQIARHRRLGTGRGPGRGYGRAAHRRRSRRDVADIDDGPGSRAAMKLLQALNVGRSVKTPKPLTTGKVLPPTPTVLSYPALMNMVETMVRRGYSRQEATRHAKSLTRQARRKRRQGSDIDDGPILRALGETVLRSLRTTPPASYQAHKAGQASKAEEIRRRLERLQATARARSVRRNNRPPRPKPVKMLSPWQMERAAQGLSP